MSGSDDLERLRADAEGLPQEAEQVQAAQVSLLLIESGQHWFGLAASSVREVVAHGAVARIPAVPSHILGMAMVSGRLVPVVAIEALTGLKSHDARLGRLVIVHDGTREIALAATRTHGLIDLGVLDADANGSERHAWISDQVLWNDSLVGLVDVSRLIDAATAGVAR